MVDVITLLIGFVATIFLFLNMIFTSIYVVIQIITSPCLFLMYVFIFAFFYTLLTAKTRKELILNQFRFFEKTATGAYNAVNASIPVIVGMSQNIYNVISGLSANAWVGSAISIFIIAIVGLYLFDSLI